MCSSSEYSGIIKIHHIKLVFSLCEIGDAIHALFKRKKRKSSEHDVLIAFKIQGTR